MKILFLLLTFCLILSVHAQRSFQQYTCLLSQDEESLPFYLEMNKVRDLDIGGESVMAGILRKNDMVEISLARTVDEVGSPRIKTEKRLYPLNARKLLVELIHPKDDDVGHILLECVPRDP